MVREVNDQPNDQPFRYGVCMNSLAFLLSNSNLSAFQFSFYVNTRSQSNLLLSRPPYTSAEMLKILVCSRTIQGQVFY